MRSHHMTLLRVGSLVLTAVFSPVASAQDVAIGSISGRLVNGVMGTPVEAGGDPPTTVQLSRCGDDGFCGGDLRIFAVGPGGEFFIDGNDDGRPIAPGDFELFARADQFELTRLLFRVEAGQNLDLGDVALTPFPLTFTNVRPCMDLPPEGGTCRYSVTLTNNAPTRTAGQALSLVTGGFGATRFEASTRRSGASPIRADFNLASRASRDLTFFFDTPSLAPDGMICTQIQAGVQPSPLFDMVRRKPLFCIVKRASSLQVLSVEESQDLLDRMRSNGATPARPSK
jgi:hypothetical protein